MKNTRIIHALAFAAAAAFAVVPAWAKDKKSAQKEHQHEHGEHHGHDHGEPDMDAAMEAWAKANAPGPHHKLMEPFVGKWKTATKMRMDPQAPWQESTGTSEVTWIFDGRFIKEVFRGEAMGMPFTGVGYYGYDNLREEHIGIWMDSMSTTISRTTGTYDPDKKVFTLHGKMDDPMTGARDIPYKIVHRLHGNDKHVMEFWNPPPGGGDMFKSMEIEYVRQ
jgi:hypothetical protein